MSRLWLYLDVSDDDPAPMTASTLARALDELGRWLREDRLPDNGEPRLVPGATREVSPLLVYLFLGGEAGIDETALTLWSRLPGLGRVGEAVIAGFG